MAVDRSQPVALVAEEHADTRLMLRELLVMHGFHVVECEDGDSAVEEAIRTVPDVVLLNGSLPKRDGIGVAHAIRYTPSTSGVPIVFVSDDGSDGCADRAIGAGCDTYMLKPIDLDDLLARVTRLLGRGGYREALRKNEHAEHI